MDSVSKEKIQEQILRLQKARIEFQRICEPILLSGMIVSKDAVQAFLNLTDVIRKCETDFSITADVIVEKDDLLM